MPTTTVLQHPNELRAACEAARSFHQRVAVVPTMGALHPGHLALITEAKRHADFVVVTVFVNPTQFGPGEDYGRYPRTWEADLVQCEAEGVSVVFAPEKEAMYPAGDATRIDPGPIARSLCGEHRPGHFAGVATVVAKLLSLVGPAFAVFGRKDFQQLRVIERVVTDLFLPASVVGCATVREPDGLAFSSRNAYLSSEERAQAACIPAALRRAAAAFAEGERRAGTLRELALGEVAAAATSIEYVSVANGESLQPLDDDATIESSALLALALRIGTTRLIDNLVLGEELPPQASSPPSGTEGGS